MNVEVSNPEGEIVQVPVPRRYLPAVIQALAQAMGKAEPQGSADPQLAPASQPSAGEPFSSFNPPGGKGLSVVAWTAEELIALRQKISNRQAPLAMMNLTADRPGSPVSFEEVYKTADVSRNSARGALAGFTQLIRREFRRNNWPVNFVWTVDSKGEGGHAEYVMPPDIAAMWRKD